MINAIGKPHPLGIHHKLLKIIGIAVAFVRLNNSFERTTNGQVILAILVENNITASNCSLT